MHMIDISLRMARGELSRRAMSLLELTVVIAILGLLSVTAIARFGHPSLGTDNAEGCARKLALTLLHARRSAISTGDNHFLQLTTSGGDIESYALYRRADGGDVQVDQIRTVPPEVSVTSPATTLEFSFEGSALASYSVSINGHNRSWNVSVVQLTGAIRTLETTP